MLLIGSVVTVWSLIGFFRAFRAILKYGKAFLSESWSSGSISLHSSSYLVKDKRRVLGFQFVMYRFYFPLWWLRSCWNVMSSTFLSQFWACETFAENGFAECMKLFQMIGNRPDNRMFNCNGKYWTVFVFRKQGNIRSVLWCSGSSYDGETGENSWTDLSRH